MNELRERIVNYVPYDEQEESDKEYILKFIDTFDDVLTRKNIFGHFCSSAFVVNKNRSKVLMIYHNIYNSWAWPGGHADGESDLLGVAMREVMEETGIKNLKPLSKDFYAIDVLPVKSHIKRGKFVSSHIHLNATYIFEADENEELLIKEDENSGVNWIDIDKMVSSLQDNKLNKDLQKAIKDERYEDAAKIRDEIKKLQ